MKHFYLLIILGALCLNLNAQQNIVGTWYIGDPVPEDITAVLTDDGTMTIEGTGKIQNFLVSYSSPFVGACTPWEGDFDITVNEDGTRTINDFTLTRDISGSIKKVVIGEGITRLGSGLFWISDNNYAKIEEVILPSTLDSINYRAFSAHRIKTESFEVPEGVTYCGTYAFEGNGASAIKTLTLPSTLLKADYDAFAITSVRTINSYAVVPPVIHETLTFNKIGKGNPLHVVQGSEADYASATGWLQFTNIIGDLEARGGNKVPTVDTPNRSLIAVSGGIKINESAKIQVYNLAGQRLFSGDVVAGKEIPLQKGVYIVKVGSKALKTLVK